MVGNQCLICDCFVAPALSVDRDVVCADVQCRRLHDQRLTMAPNLYAPYLAFQKSLIRERRSAEAANRAKVARIISDEDEEGRLALQEYVTANGRCKDIDLITLPSVPQHTVPLSEERRKKYIRHLETEMAEAVGCEDVSELPHDQHYTLIDRRIAQDAFLAENPELARRSDVFCEICRGGCCMKGGDSAYVSAVMLRRQLDADPELTPESLLSAYIGSIPEAAIDGGCINQGEAGCGLPRDMRSDVCNHFLCEPVRDYQAKSAETNAISDVFVVQRSNHQWNRFASESANALVACYLVDDVGYHEVSNAHETLIGEQDVSRREKG